MRKSVFTLVATVFWVTSMFTNCELSATKIADEGDKDIQVKENMALAKQDRVQAQRDSVADYRKFKAQSDARVIKNSQIIADFNVRIMTGEKAMKARYQKRLGELEKKNNAMKYQLEQYSEIGTDKREVFKRTWDTDMDNLVKSLNEMTGNNH